MTRISRATRIIRQKLNDKNITNDTTQTERQEHHQTMRYKLNDKNITKYETVRTLETSKRQEDKNITNCRHDTKDKSDKKDMEIACSRIIQIIETILKPKIEEYKLK